MALNYKPLWIQLIQKEIRKIDLIQMAGLTSNTMAKMGKNEPISFKNLERICKALSCSPNDVISFDFEEEKISIKEEAQKAKTGGEAPSSYVEGSYEENFLGSPD